jgi:HPt (histidine-containing phosphotransfer) domain-containing protein
MTKDTMTDTTVVLDQRQVADLLALDGGNGALLSAFVNAFTAGAEVRIAHIRVHAEAQDAAALAEQAHSLRGAAGNVGAVRLAALLEQVESAAKRGDLGAASALAAGLEAEFALAKAALARACESNF